MPGGARLKIVRVHGWMGGTGKFVGLSSFVAAG